MKDFKIYVNPLNHAVAVKQGFSWPGFFFGWIWAFVKKLWLYGIAIIGLTFGAFFIAGLLFNDPDTIIGVYYILCIGIAVTVGYLGNGWVEKNYVNNGYKFKEIIPANNPEHALNLYFEKVNNKNEEVNE